MGNELQGNGVINKGTPNNAICKKCNDNFIQYIGGSTIKGKTKPMEICDKCNKIEQKEAMDELHRQLKNGELF